MLCTTRGASRQCGGLGSRTRQLQGLSPGASFLTRELAPSWIETGGSAACEEWTEEKLKLKSKSGVVNG